MTELEIFWAIIGRSFKQREADNLELMARIIERGNARLAGLPEEGEWT